MQGGDSLEDVPARPVESDRLLASGNWTGSTARHEQVDLPGGLQAPQHARRAIEEHFGAAVDSATLASVELLTTELVSNAVRHGGADEDEVVVLHLALAPACLRIEVCDPGDGFDAGTPQPYGEGGYGLFLVSEVSSRWGVARARSNVTWFEMDF